MKRFFLILAVLSTSCSSKIYNQTHTYRFIETDTLGVSYQGVLERTLERKNIKDDTLQFDFTYWGGWKDSKFYSEGDTIYITNNGVEREFLYWTSEMDTVVLDICKQFNPSTYDDDYKANNGGKVNVEIPQVYELVNILVALTSNAQPNWVNKDTEYYKRVMEYFATFKNHPVFEKLNAELSSGSYLNIRENSAAYVFNGQRIVRSSTYSGFRARDKFKKLLPFIQDFAMESNFHSFYQSEKHFYEKLESLEYERAQVKEAWSWLQEQFPDRVDSYRIIMSPLAGGSHSIRLFENNNFKENIIFMSAPSMTSKDSVSQSIEDALALRRAFTEMDHNYVNPTSDKYTDVINGAMADLMKWNTKESYNSPYETFNEYMTWAVFGLYVYDRFGESTYKKVMLQPIDFMQNNRGFVKFSAFNNHLLVLFRKYDGKKKVPELYPELLEWVKNENYSS